jgi:hypothetical protein
MLDVMLEYFDGGKRWMRDALRDASGEHRCLIGALRDVRQQQRIRGAGAEFDLGAALLSTLDELDLSSTMPWRDCAATTSRACYAIST